jgi:hypothetical protein
MSAYLDYVKTSFEELEQKTKNTEWEGKKVHSYLDEYTGAPMVELGFAKKLKLKNVKDVF